MSDSYSDPHQNGRNYEGGRDVSRGGYRSGSRGGRPQGNREGGGFRIRLSDNEMNAARSIQEAFNLRSTVAVLGFALRTLAQMLEDGSLESFVNEYKSQTPSNDSRREQNARGESFNLENKNQKSKPNPFARPEKPKKETEPELSSSEEETPLEENDSAANETSIEEESSKTVEQK